jgi:hypothetical protein
MNRTPLHSDYSLETDAVWKLLDQATPAAASPRFVDDTVRAARLAGQPQAWWKRLLTPAPLAGLAGATAALVFTVISLSGPTPEPGSLTTAFDSEHAAAIQEIAATETLLAAVDNLDEFSDNELVCLIGF